MASSSPISNGALQVQTTWGDFNNIIFAIQQAIAKMQTATLVKIISCTNNGGVSPFGFVDVQPLVNQIDGNGNPTPHATIHNLPYLRIQGGANAVIIDPQAGDIGVAVFASRDISKVKNTQAQGNPGSLRQYDFSDGMYIGGMLNAVPTQYVQFSSEGISVVSPNTITLKAPNIVLEGDVSQSEGNVTIGGSLTVTEDVTGQGTSLHTHTHTSSTPGNPTSPPL